MYVGDMMTVVCKEGKATVQGTLKLVLFLYCWDTAMIDGFQQLKLVCADSRPRC